MRKHLLGLVLALSAAGPAALSAEVPPDAASLLFEEPQLDNTKPGDVLTYAYSRKTADEPTYGPSFTDQVRLAIAPGSNAETRTVAVDLFSGEHKRAAGPFEDMTGNPMLSLFLENHVNVLSGLLQVNPRYLKNAIRGGLRDHATVEPVTVSAGGQSLPGYRVHIAPFAADPNKERMKGLDTLAYDFTVARDLPGEIAEIRITAPDAKGGADLLDETVVFDAPAR